MNTETAVHISVRKFLKQNGWILIAGQYPGGSDDEVSTLYIVDPIVARDNSPDHRRHSLGKFVPDIVAIKDERMLIVEAKPTYSEADKLKLDDLLLNHSDDMWKAINGFQQRHNRLPDLMNLRPVPCLAFFAPKSGYPIDDRFVYIVTEDVNNASWHSVKEKL